MKKAKRAYDMTARAAGAAATKERIRATAVALYCERPVEDFTLAEVAARADTTVQTILRDFGSKDELIYTALADMAAAGQFLKPATPGDTRAAVTAIFDIYEPIGDMVIQRLGDERRRPALKPSLDEGRVAHRDGVKTVFAPQLQRLSGVARTQLLTMLTIATDVYVWKLLRRDLALGRAAAESIMVRMLNGIITGEAANGTDSLAELVGRRQSAS
ncbi:MAG TPA: helix-turn-helix domain-containing protein [Stellaceae bacterium]|jgi:AcrR family transcriptional regulator|nr:helix-turn-helix domain-containing protein [Stellaceae bacterium]